MPPMTTIPVPARPVELDVDVDVATLDLAVEELRGAADRRRNVAEKLSGELTAQKRTDPKFDMRTGATQVVKVLGEADDLRNLADQLEAARKGLPRRRRTPVPEPVAPGPGDDPSPGDDDGVPLDAAHDPDVIAVQRMMGRDVSPGPEPVAEDLTDTTAVRSSFDGEELLDDDPGVDALALEVMAAAGDDEVDPLLLDVALEQAKLAAGADLTDAPTIPPPTSA